MTSLRTLTALVICLMPAFVSGQGLGGAAAREKQRRASGQKTAQPAKTYTEESLKGLPPVESPGSSGGPATSTGASDVAKGGSSFLGREGSSDTSEEETEENERAQAEAEWRTRVDAARARVEKARERASYYESLVITPGVTYVDENGATVIGSVQQLQGMTRKAKADLAAAEKALEDLLEEARRASVPPGWLR